MDVKCPFCSEVVEVPEGTSESAEIECPACRAGFDVTAARLFSDDAEMQVADLEPQEERKETEAWLKNDDDPEEAPPPPPVVPNGEDSDSQSDSPATEAWVRDDDSESERPVSAPTSAPVGGYGFSGKELAHADEVFLPPDQLLKRKKPDAPPPEPPRAVLDDLTSSPEIEAPFETADEPPVFRPETPLSEPEFIAPEPPVEARSQPPVDNVFEPSVGMPEPPVHPTSPAEPAGIDDFGTDLPSFDDLLPPMDEASRVEVPPPVPQDAETDQPMDPTMSWMGAGPKPESEVLLPPPPEPDSPSVDSLDGAESERSGSPISVADFDIPESLDLVQQSGFEAELPEPKDSVAMQDEPTEEWEAFTQEPPAEKPAKEVTSGLDLSFDDLEVPGAGVSEVEKSSDTAAIGSLDIDAALSDDSEPEGSLAFGEGDGESDGKAVIGGVDSIFEAKSPPLEGGTESLSELGLPDAWPDSFDADEDAGISGTPPLPGVDIPPALDLGQDADQAMPPSVMEMDGDLVTEMIPEVREPALETRKAPAVRQRKVQVGGSSLKLALMGVVLVALLGVILGQTEYGYFGFNLFVPDDMDLRSGQKVVSSSSDSAGIIRDTKESFQEELIRLESLVREDPEDEKSKADLLEILLRFRERYPGVLASNPKMSARLEFLEKKTSVKGQKAAIVRVMNLVNSGKYSEAKTVLDGMVVATAQDADVLYFYGKVTLGQGNFNEAQKYFELALIKNPALIAAKYFLAVTQLEMKEAEKGQAILKEILVSEPEHVAAKVKLAQLALQDRDEDGAAKLVGEVIAKTSSDSYSQELFEAHLVMAGVQEIKGTAEGRLQELLSALALKPTDERTAMIVSELMTTGGEKEEALKVLEPCRVSGCKSVKYLAMYARAAFEAEREEKAGEALKAGAADYPESPAFAIIRGKYLMKVGRPRAASSAFEEAVRIQPSSIEANVMLAKALSKEGKLHQATGKLIEGLKHVDDKVPLLETLAATYREKRDYVSAESTLRQVISANASNYKARQQLGLVVLSLERPSEASKILEVLEKRHALDRDGILGLAEAYLKQGLASKAKAVLSKLYGKDESDPNVGAEYGRALTESNRLKEAQKVLKSVVDSHPSHAAGHFYLGKLFARQKKMQRAADSLLRSVQLNSSETLYRLELAKVLLNQGGTEYVRDAKLQLDKVVNSYTREEVPLEQQEADAYMLRGRILFEQEKFSMAMYDFEEALALEPSRLDLLLNFGTTLYEMARYDESIPYFEQILRRDKAHAESNYYLGRMMLRKGEIDRAKGHLQLVAQKHSKRFPEALRYLGLIYRDQKLKPLAKKTFAAYLKLAPKNTSEATEIRRLLDRM